MAELATLARPYAEAMFQVALPAEAERTGDELEALAAIAVNPQLRQFADDPKIASSQVHDLIGGALPLSPATGNLLRAVLDNGRLAVLPEIAAQYRALVNQRSGVSEAAIYSAFAIDDGLLAEVVGALERRFRRKLTAQVHVDPALIGGIRVVVGDEVLDTSVKSRLAQMKAALTA